MIPNYGINSNGDIFRLLEGSKNWKQWLQKLILQIRIQSRSASFRYRRYTVNFFKVERDQLDIFLNSITTASLSEEQFLQADRIIQVAHDRYDAGLRAVKERRTLAERFVEMKFRQANGEPIYYDAIPVYVVSLVSACGTILTFRGTAKILAKLFDGKDIRTLSR